MHFHHHTAFEDIKHLRDDWDHLLQKSASHVPFLTFDYQQAWWSTHGGGEWPESSQLVLITANDGDQFVGAAPLFFSKNILGKPALMLVGAIEVSDFLDLIAPPEILPDFIHGLLDFLTTSKDIPQWEVLDLYNILEDSPTLDILQQEAEIRQWTYQQKPLQPSPYIPLPDDFDAYLAGIDKKQRHEIRRKLRNVTQSLAEGSLYITEDPGQLESDVNTFINMMEQDPNKRAFLTDAMREHLHRTAQTAFEGGWLNLAFFTLDGNKAAANFSFLFNNRLWLYNSAWEWDYREFSPGWVLLAYLIEWAINNQLDEFDFMRGDEPYKYKFGGIDRRIVRATLTP